MLYACLYFTKEKHTPVVFYLMEACKEVYNNMLDILNFE